jgi:citrate lyase subunit beta/citryl-CoA lyase
MGAEVIMRTMLFVPGDKERLLLKSLELGTDAVIWDVEDAVALPGKELARAAIGNALEAAPAKHVPIYVRINAFGTNLLDADLNQIVRPGLCGVILSKAESQEQVRELDSLLSLLERANGLSERAIKVNCLIETCLGVLHAYAIATASPRVAGVSFGAEDFTLDLGAARTREGNEVAYARAAVAVAAGAAKILAIDTVYPDLKDEEGLANECRRARQLGFKGKFAIHPKQLETINREFSPSEGELAYAEKVVIAFRKAEEEKRGVITVDGKMIDGPIVERAKLILRLKAAD